MTPDNAGYYYAAYGAAAFLYAAYAVSLRWRMRAIRRRREAHASSARGA